MAQFNLAGYMTPEEEAIAQNPQTLNLLGEIGNSPSMQYQPQMPQMPEQAQAPVQAEAPVATSEQAPQEDKSFLKGLADGLANAFTNPDTISALQAFGSSMAGDLQGYNQNMSAYAQRINERRQSATAGRTQAAMEARQSNQEFRKALYDSYKPEYVNKYLMSLRDKNDMQSGDWSVFQDPNATSNRYQIQQQRADAGTLNANTNVTNANTRQDAHQETTSNNAANLQLKQQQLQQDKLHFEATQDLKQKELSDKQKTANNTQWDDNEKSMTALENADNTINGLLNAPGFNNYFGSIQGRLPNISEESQGIESRFGQLKGQQFLQMASQLKGQGALSDAEGAKLTAAAGRLYDADGKINQKISDTEARQALDEIREVIAVGKARLQEKQKALKTPDYATGSATMNQAQGQTQAPQGEAQRIKVKNNGKVIWVDKYPDGRMVYAGDA